MRSQAGIERASRSSTRGAGAVRRSRPLAGSRKATPGTIMAIFMVQGTVIGVVGTAIGALVGMFAALNVSAAISALEGLIGHKFLNADVYFIDYLPSQLQAQDVLMVCGAALVLSFLATLYPAWRAARTQPAQALRYE